MSTSEDRTNFQKAYRKVLDLPDHERRAFIDTEYASAPDIQERLRQLIGPNGEDLFLLPSDEQDSRLDELDIHEGIQLGDFRLLHEIGRGGMGVVYLAEQESLGRQVALKLFRPAMSGGVLEQQDFVKEARAIAKLRHPGVVPVYTVGEAAGFPYFALEYVPGSDLSEEIQKVAKGEETILPKHSSEDYFPTVARIVAEIAEALAHAHGQGLLHRDLKPSNILLDEEGVARLTDFGLAKSTVESPETVTAELKGTVYYMSPEQVRERKPKQDIRSDIYSLGVVLYEALSLNRPYQGSSFTQVIHQIQKRDPNPVRKYNSRIPRDLALICATAMAKRPEDRYADASSFAADLRRFIAHESISVEPPSSLHRVLRWVSRHRLPIAMTVMAIVAGAMGLLGSGKLRDHQNFPQISVVATDMRYQRVNLDGVVSVRKVDLLTGVPGALRKLGTLPLSNYRVPPGYYRIVVAYPDGWFTEHIRHLEDGDQQMIRSVHRSGPFVKSSDWVAVSGGDFDIPEEAPVFWPLNNVSVPVAGFQISKTEATIGQYQQYLTATETEYPAWWKTLLWSRDWDELPVTLLTWHQFRDFAEWSGARLPTLWEWERAAHGEKMRTHTWPNPQQGPWRGNTQGVVGAVFFRENVGIVDPLSPQGFLWTTQQLRSVTEANGDVTAGAYGQAAGLLHLVGNVHEYTETVVLEDVDGEMTPSFNKRVSLSGSWEASFRSDNLQTLLQSSTGTLHRTMDTGVRFTKSLTP